MSMAKSTKRATIEMLERLPDDVSLDEIMYELYFRQQVEAGLEDVRAGRTIPHDQVMRELAEWLKSIGPKGRSET
jgi:predicted transcriptional regulator